MEQEEYTREEIDWSYIEFVDNKDVLDLIEKVSSFSLAEKCSSICTSISVSLHSTCHVSTTKVTRQGDLFSEC